MGLTACALPIAAPLAAGAGSQYVFSGRAPAGLGDRLEVTNINGPVSVVQTSGGEAHVRAKVSAQSGDARAVRIQVTRVGSTVYVCPVYPGTPLGRDCKQHGSNSDNDNVRVEFAIELPRGVSLHAGTVNGTIDARDLDANIDAGSVNGNITLSTSRTAQAKTVNGSIDAGIGARRWNGSLSFGAVNGSVTVRLPRNAAFTLNAGTLTGSIHITGFPLAEAQSSGPVGHSVRGTVGSGGGTLAMKTLNGALRLDAR
jgi:hypothetical protein